MTAELHATGHVVNHKKVMRLMREHGLTVRPRRRFVATTDSDHDGPIFPNLAKDVVPPGPNQLWVADITYIAITVGFVTVAAILMPGRAWLGMRLAGASRATCSLPGRAAIAARKAPPARPSFRRGSHLCGTTAPRSRNTVSEARWVGAATPTTTPRQKAS